MSTQPDSTNTTTESSAAPVDAAAIADALLRISAPGQVIELRALEASLGKRQPGTLSGYFNDPQRLAHEVGRITSAKGIYFTLNPLNPALLARAENRIKYASRGESAADGDVTARRRMLVDLDPVRPSGVSATDAEHEAALAKAFAIVAAMCALGWPEPIIADSGNGAHLLYWIDLPAVDDGLIERCLAAFAKQFNDKAVTIDLKVFNPARICRLYGTWARKGDNTVERPHRCSRIVKAPAELQVVERSKLEEFAGPKPVAEPKTTGKKRSSRSGAPFDLTAWIQLHNLPVDGPSPWKDKDGVEGVRWVFDVCPFNSAHTNKSAFIIQFENGAISAGCHHSGCADKDWHALRDLVEPGWRAPQYVATSSGLFWKRDTNNGVVYVPLTNFTARIVADVARDDGVETAHVFAIEAMLHRRRHSFDVPAIARGCRNAFSVPHGLTTDNARRWKSDHHWSPNRLRHNAATFLRKEFGIEVARVVLGHTSAGTTEIYAEIDQTKAAEVMAQVGYAVEVKKSAAPRPEWASAFGPLERLEPSCSEAGVVCLCRERLPLTAKVSAIPVGLL
ncbi:MAG: site-specific integrase [Phycisphaerales bacterium]|nr:site-specific integrase [Phycisphaerales bacterium]